MLKPLMLSFFSTVILLASCNNDEQPVDNSFSTELPATRPAINSIAGEYGGTMPNPTGDRTAMPVSLSFSNIKNDTVTGLLADSVKSTAFEGKISYDSSEFHIMANIAGVKNEGGQFEFILAFSGMDTVKVSWRPDDDHLPATFFKLVRK